MKGKKYGTISPLRGRYDFSPTPTRDSASYLKEMDPSGGKERRRRSGMGMDQESMCVWTLRTSPSAVVGFNPPLLLHSLLTWSIPELQIPSSPILTPPTRTQLCIPFAIVAKRNGPFPFEFPMCFPIHLIPRKTFPVKQMILSNENNALRSYISHIIT